MKPVHLTLLLFSFFLILMVARPIPKEERQAEEAPFSEEIGERTYRIHYEISEEEEDAQMADINWFKRAAEAALLLDNPLFNVLERSMKEHSVEGIIQLERDPMKAEYDAHEILGLQVNGRK